jgi:hypothetical protein
MALGDSNMKRKRIPKKIKDQLLVLCKNACMICGTPYTVSHHIEPICEGGGNDWLNLSVLCPNCHHRVHILKDISESQLRLYRQRAEDGLLNKPVSMEHITADSNEKKMWGTYFFMLPTLKEGKPWLPKNPEEIMFAEQLVQHGVLERSAPGEYHSPGAEEDYFACRAILR